MIFTLRKFAASGNLLGKTAFIALFFIIAYFINLPTVPKAAKATPFPFPASSCLAYSVDRFNQTAEPENYEREICFQSLDHGGFIEKSGNMQTTFDKNGFADLTDEDIKNWKQNLGAKSDPFFEQMASKLDFHNKYFSQPRLKPGTIFYDKYPVAKITEFNGKKAFMVEANPWTDTRLTHRGVLSRFWWSLQYKYNRLIYKPTERKSGSRDVVERHYYGFDTGILEGKERLLVERSIEGKVLSSTIEERSTLTRIADNKQ